MDVLNCFVNIIGDRNEIDIGCGYKAVANQMISNPIDESLPKLAADQNDRRRGHFFCLYQGDGLEKFVQGSKSPWQGYIGSAMHEKGRLARNKIFKLQAMGLIGVVAGFAR